MGHTPETTAGIRERLEEEGIRSMPGAYELGAEDSYKDGYEIGAEDERADIVDGGLVIRWSDGKVYMWNGAVLKWEHAPHRWAEALNGEGG